MTKKTMCSRLRFHNLKKISSLVMLIVLSINIIPMSISANVNHKDNDHPIVIAHRGASGHVPEHTLAAYSIAILQGADFIEPDLVITKDGVLIARHDNVLNLTTNVANMPRFTSKETTKVVDGSTITGWFSEDFTLEEIKEQRAIERIPQYRPHNRKFNDMFEIPTLQEIIDLVQSLEKATNRAIGIYPETKHPTHFDNLNLSMEEPLVEILKMNGYEGKKRKVFIQSFEIGNLKDLNKMTNIPLVQLLWLSGQPYDIEEAGGSLTYDDMATTEGLADIAEYADGVGPEKYHFIIPKDSNNNLDINNATSFVKDAHDLGLLVHPYTFRSENTFLPDNLRNGADPIAIGDSAGEIKIFLQTGIDGFFTDQSDIGVKARDELIDN